MSYRILVVEDDHELRNIVMELLEDEDYFVKGAANVRDAVKLSEKMPFDLVVTDVRMPNSENGVEGFELLKKRLPNLKCIVMTGYSDLLPRKKAIELGVLEYIYKPFTLDELLSAVDRVANDRKWALFYANVIQKGPLRVMTRIFQALKKDNVSEVNEARAQVFSALYLAISSDRDPAKAKDGTLSERVLPERTANGLYYELECCDADYESFLNEPKKETGERLIRQYTELLERFKAFIRTGMALVPKGQLEPHRKFLHLYRAIQARAVNFHDFLLAPALRVADTVELSDSPELLQLKQKLWGAD